MANRTIRTPKNREAFLASLRDGKSISAAALDAGIGRRTAFEWRLSEPDFAAAWDEAVEEGTDRLEDEAHRRARDGTSKPVFHQGQQCGTVQEFSDTLMIFMLKARRRSKFGDKQEIGGIDGGAIEIADVSSARRKAALALLLARKGKDVGGS